MKRDIKISRPANGAHTVVTVTLTRNGVSVKYAERTFARSIAVAVESAINGAEDMLRQAEEFIEREGQGS